MARLKPALTAALVALVIAGLIWALMVWNSGRAESPASDLGEPLTIATVTWVGFGPFYVAENQGYFQDEGVEVDVRRIEDLGALRAALASGNVDFIVHTIDSWAVGAAEGLDAVAVLKTDESYGGDGLVVRPDVDRIEDLRGKEVAFPRGLAGHFFLIKLLRDAGLSASDIQPVYMEAPDAAAAFISGKVDAALTWEPFLTEAAEIETGKLLATTKDHPGVILDILLASKALAEERPEDITKVLAAWFRAVDYTNENPDSAAAIMEESFGIPPGEVRGMLAGLRFTSLHENQRAFGIGAEGTPPIVETFNAAGRIYETAGLIEDPVFGAEYFNGSFVSQLGQ